MLLRKSLQKFLEEKLKQLNKKRPLSPSISEQLRERFEVEMTYNSNAIILDDIDKTIAGVYRKTDVFITGSDHKPPSALGVSAKMNELIGWAKENHKKLHIVEFSAMFHHKFVQIHPFQDGNGRTGRLLMNIFLMQFGFPLAIIQNNDRQKYYRVLTLADQGNFKPLIDFIAQAVLRSLTIYLDSIIPAEQKDDLITLAEATKYCSYSQAYLGKLAKEGRLEAVKLKRNWMTTKEAVKRYLESQN